MDSLHVILNENKDLFIINRYNNRLYAFLYNADEDSKYVLKTFKFNKDFQIDSVDSSIAQDDKGRNNKLISVWSKNRILVISSNKLSELNINDWDQRPTFEKTGT